MKKTYLTAIALVLFLIIGAGSVSAGNFALGADSVVAENGKTVQIPLMVEGANLLDAYELNFEFDNSSVPGTTAKVSKNKTQKPITILPTDNYLGGSVGGSDVGVSGTQTIGYIDVTLGENAGNLIINITSQLVYENGDEVTYTGTELELEITKGPAYISDITADKPYIIDSTVTFTATINNSNHEIISGLKPTWSSSNSLIAKVVNSDSGEFELLTEGDVFINAYYPGLDTKQLPIKVLGTYNEVDNTIDAGAKLNGWNNNTGATATYHAMITDKEYKIAIPEYTRNFITAPILKKDDNEKAGIKVTKRGLEDGEIELVTINDDNTITIPAASDEITYEGYEIVFTGRKLGDVNGDGDVTLMDATMITRYVVSTLKDSLDEYEKFYANVDGAGQITASDALCIMEMRAGLRDGAYDPTDLYWEN